MIGRSRAIFVVLSLAQPLTVHDAAQAADISDIAGDYICKKGCRNTDAPPGIEIKGDLANCMSELGGIYSGRRLSKASVYCFNMIGTLSPDGREVRWSNGNIWERR